MKGYNHKYRESMKSSTGSIAEKSAMMWMKTEMIFELLASIKQAYFGPTKHTKASRTFIKQGEK